MGSESTKKALERYFSRQLVPVQKSQARKHNSAPEKEVQKQIHAWLLQQNFFAFRVEAKAVFSQAAGRYLQGQTVTGCADELAVCPNGRFVAVEVKAPGKRSTLRPDQRTFLLNVIARNGFACVSDSVSHVSNLWTKYNSSQDALKKSVLLNDLPKEKPDLMDRDLDFDVD